MCTKRSLANASLVVDIFLYRDSMKGILLEEILNQFHTIFIKELV
jgi:hypothetical protein